MIDNTARSWANG